MSIISKELLSEVLGVYVRDGWYFDCELLIYTHDKILGLDENYHSQINIYELAFRTREYLKTKSKHLSLNQSIDDIFKEANDIYESLSK